MHTDLWQSLGIIAGAILALTAVWRKVLMPMWRGFWRLVHHLDRAADDILGDKDKGIPSMSTRLTVVEETIAPLTGRIARLEYAMATWHGPTLPNHAVAAGRGRHHHPGE